MASKSNVVRLKRRSPIAENGKVTPPKRVANAKRRTREHLIPSEVERVIKAASRVGRHGPRDAALVQVMYRHGLRVSELVALRWDQVDLKQGLLHVNRVKNGVPSTHPLRGPELRALRQLQRDYPGVYVFSTERGGPMTTATATVRKMVAKGGEFARLTFPIHPHMLRLRLLLQTGKRRSRHTGAAPIPLGIRTSTTHGAVYRTCAQIDSRTS